MAPSTPAPLTQAGYVGRFAPSPTGPLHAGSLVAALASWLDARAVGGRWLLRIEDLDPPREVPGAARAIGETLLRIGLEPDGPIEYQSANTDRYRAALEQLQRTGHAYRCACSRRAVETAIAALPRWPAGVYPGTCSQLDLAARVARAWRFRVPPLAIGFEDRLCGVRQQDLAREVGDFIIRRADGLWAYQLAVVVDDAAQQVTHVVRGADLLDNTPRQIALQRALGLATPSYLHVPLVVNERGEKLSKQTGAAPLDTGRPLAELQRAARHLGLREIDAGSTARFLSDAITAWRERLAGMP